MSCRERVANLLLQENNLMQIVKLIGSDVLPDDQKLTIEIARVIRVGFLQQNAFHAVDTYVPLEKQLKTCTISVQRWSPSRCRSAVCWPPACLMSWSR